MGQGMTTRGWKMNEEKGGYQLQCAVLPSHSSWARCVQGLAAMASPP